MLNITKNGNSLLILGEDHVYFPKNGELSVPLNSIIVETDESDIVTFRSAATNDVLFSGKINQITIEGEAVTKDNVIEKFGAISNSSQGGGGGAVNSVNGKTGDVVITATDIDTYSKEYIDETFAAKEDVESELNKKQDTLVSGTNIKTINGESLLGEGNIEIQGGSEGDPHFKYNTNPSEMQDGKGIIVHPVVKDYGSYLPISTTSGTTITATQSRNKYYARLTDEDYDRSEYMGEPCVIKGIDARGSEIFHIEMYIDRTNPQKGYVTTAWNNSSDYSWTTNNAVINMFDADGTPIDNSNMPEYLDLTQVYFMFVQNAYVKSDSGDDSIAKRFYTMYNSSKEGAYEIYNGTPKKLLVEGDAYEKIYGVDIKNGGVQTYTGDKSRSVRIIEDVIEFNTPDGSVYLTYDAVNSLDPTQTHYVKDDAYTYHENTLDINGLSFTDVNKDSGDTYTMSLSMQDLTFTDNGSSATLNYSELLKLNNLDTSNFLTLQGGTLNGRLVVGGVNNDSITNAYTHLRKVNNKYVGMAFSVGSQGEASVQHKAYADGFTSARNDAVLSFDYANGLRFGKTASGNVAEADMKRVLLEDDLDAINEKINSFAKNQAPENNLGIAVFDGSQSGEPVNVGDIIHNGDKFYMRPLAVGETAVISVYGDFVSFRNENDSNVNYTYGYSTPTQFVVRNMSGEVVTNIPKGEACIVEWTGSDKEVLNALVFTRFNGTSDGGVYVYDGTDSPSKVATMKDIEELKAMLGTINSRLAQIIGE